MYKKLKIAMAKGLPFAVFEGPCPSAKRLTGVMVGDTYCCPLFPPWGEPFIEDFITVFKEKPVLLEVKNVVKSYFLGYQGYIPKTKPLPYQEDCLKYALERPRAALFLDMGLGKTKVAIDVMAFRKVKTLVIGPLVTLPHWEQEIVKHSDLSSKVLHGSKDKRAKCLSDLSGTDVLITNFESAKAEGNKITEAFGQQMIIIDESHRIKSRKAAVTKACLQLAKSASFRLLLSGTPVLGDPMDMFTQLKFLGEWTVPEGFWEFKKKFCRLREIRVQGRKVNIVEGYKHLDILNDRVSEVAVRLIKEEVLDLPERMVIDLEVSMKGDQKKAYKDLLRQASTDLDGSEFSAETALEMILRLQQITGGHISKTVIDLNDLSSKIVGASFKSNAKLERLKDLLKDLFANPKNKVIIWARFLSEVQDIALVCQGLGVDTSVLTGSVKDKGSQVRKFQEDSECRAFIGQISCGIGINLTSSSYMVYYSLTTKLEDYYQSLDRNYRIGQSNKVTVYRMMAKDTIDEALASAIDHKKDIVEMVLSEKGCPVCQKGNVPCVHLGKAAKPKLR